MAIRDFNYNQAISQANQIETVANDMMNVANRELKDTLDSIGACWQGEASRQFVGYCGAVKADILTQAKSLQDTARRIREVARIIKEAEDRARELQRQREAAARAAQAAMSPIGSTANKPKTS